MHAGNILVHAGSSGAMDGSSHLVFLITGPCLREVTLLDRRNNTSDPRPSWDHHVTRESLNILFLNSNRLWAIFTAFRIWKTIGKVAFKWTGCVMEYFMFRFSHKLRADKQSFWSQMAPHLTPIKIKTSFHSVLMERNILLPLREFGFVNERILFHFDPPPNTISN